MSVITQLDSAHMSLLRTATKVRKNAKRKLVVSKLDTAAVAHCDNPILASCAPGFQFGFTKTLTGAIVNRAAGSHGEIIRLYNTQMAKWECYPVRDFESRFFPVSPAIQMNAYAIIGNVFAASAGKDYDTEWTSGMANVALRIIRI